MGHLEGLLSSDRCYSGTVVRGTHFTRYNKVKDASVDLTLPPVCEHHRIWWRRSIKSDLSASTGFCIRYRLEHLY